MVFYFKYTVFWETVSRVTVITVTWVLYKLKIVNLILHTSLFIYTTISKVVRRGHQICKWMVICIQTQGNHDFWSGSDKANHMRFHALLESSVQIVILYLVLVPGWKYSLVTWRIISVLLARNTGEYHSQFATSLNYIWWKKIFPGNMILLRFSLRII